MRSRRSSSIVTLEQTRTRRSGSHLAVLAALLFSLFTASATAQQSTTGDWKTNGNGTWSAAANWNNLDAGTSYPSAVDGVANFINQITTTRTVTVDVGVTLGTLNIGDLSGGSSFTISGGTITFDVTSGFAQLNKVNDGGNDTINSNIVLNDPLAITINDPSNNQGLLLNGIISGGVNGTTTITFNDLSAGTSLNWLYVRGANTFEGQVLVESGLLRYENVLTAAGATGVGNETIVTSGGSVDLRNTDFSINGVDDTEIFMLGGLGVDGRGALRNTSGTANLNHIIVTSDTMVGGYSSMDLLAHTDSGGTNQVAAILDMGGFAFSKIGTNEFRIRNADIQNIGTFNVYEGELSFQNYGDLVGGTPGDHLNDLTGATINVYYNKNPFDGVDPANGTRTLDPFTSAAVTATNGNSISDSRLSFGTYFGGTFVLNTKAVETHDNFTVNLSNGVWQRQGSGSTGQTFDQIFGPGVTINLVDGGIGNDGVGSGNMFDMSGGSGNYNSTTGVFDHPGVTEIQGTIDNTSPGNNGTGFTDRGNRELRITGDNSTSFDGDILIKRPTGRWITNSFTTSGTAPAASEYTNMSIAGVNGSFSGANSITITRWGSLALLNNSANAVYASVNNNNRLNDNGTLIMRNGFIKLETDVTVPNTENLGNYVADYGTNYLYLDTRAGGQFDGSIESFTSNNNGVLKIYVTNPAHTFGAGATDDRLKVNNTAGITLVGSGALGTTSAPITRSIFGTVLPTLATPTIGAYTRSLETVQGTFMYAGGGMTLMTLDGGYLRPLTSSEFDTSAAPVAGTNWLVNGYINPVSGNENYGDRNNYAARNVTSDIAVNSLSITFDATASGDANPGAAKDYVIIETGKTLKIDSGMINYSNYIEADSANMETIIRGGSLDFNGQIGIVNSNAIWQDTNRNTANWYEVMTGNNGFIRSHITNATGLIKTGRNNLYLETYNDITGNIYISEQGSIIARHPGSLGAGGAGREVQIGGASAFLLEYGTNITGIDVRVTNTLQGSATVLRNEGTTHSTWGGDVILDVADETGTSEFQSYTITARNNGTLSLYGNVYTDNNANFTDSDSFSDPPLVTTSIGETFTLNLRGQFRDVATGNLATDPANAAITSVFRTGDSATRLDANHSLRFQMTGHDEGNVNVFQQWDATGRIDLRQGYFRIQYDPNAAGNDGTGFFTDGARSLRAANDYYTRAVLGTDGTSTTNAYHSHLMLTQDGQVFNAPLLYAYNDNRNGTLTIGGENTSGTVYFGSSDNLSNFSLQFVNQSTERDIRFLQMRGGTMVFNGRLDDENSTVQSFNASVSIVGPGTVIFNRNAIGSSDIDRWNFMAGETHWSGMTGNNQFASASTQSLAGRSSWGGGGLVLDDPGGTTMRTQTLNSNLYLFNGSSYAQVNQNTTLTLGSATAVMDRRSGSSLAFLEDGNGAINLTTTTLSTTAGDFLGSWAVYGSSAGVTDWAGRQGTTGVQAFAGYTDDTLGTGVHTNFTIAPPALASDDSSATIRFGAAASLDLGGFVYTLEEGGLLVPSTIAGTVNITNGTLTSGWTAGSGDLMLQNFGTGSTAISAIIADNGGKVNLVNAGSGTTVLSGSNTYTGDTFINGGVLEISSDANLGLVNASIAKIVRVGIGTNNGASLSGQALTFTTNGGGTGASGTYNSNSSQQITSLSLTNGGSGYTSGVYVSTDKDSSGDVTGDGNGGVRAIMDSGNLHIDGGTLHVTETMSLNGARTLFLGGNGATLRVDAGKKLTIDGYISSEFNHVIQANGFTTVNQVRNAWQQASDGNPDIGDLTIAGGGTVVLSGAPDGTARAYQVNSYGGITWLNEGILHITSAGSSAGGDNGYAGILGTNRSWVDGTIIGAQGTLRLSTTSDPVFREWFTFRGQGYEGRGTIETIGTARSYNLAGQLFLEENVLINSRNSSNIRFNNGGGTMYGSGDIIKLGNGALQMYGNAPDWTGSIYNASGSFYMTSAGNLQGMTSLNLARNTIFYDTTGSTSIDEFRDRLPDNLPINTDGYIRLRMDATSGIFSGEERAGVLTVLGGQAGLEFNMGGDIVAGVPRLQGDYAVWHFDQIVRSPGTSVHVRSLDSGTEFATKDFLTTQFQNVAGVQVDTLPALIGSGDGTNGDAPVVPGFFGGVRPAWINLAGTGNIFNEDRTSNRIMTADTTVGGAHYLRPLTDSEYFSVANPNDAQTTAVDLTTFGITSDQNLRIVGVITDTGIGAGEFTNRRNSLLNLGDCPEISINSLTFESESFTDGAAAANTGNFTSINMAANQQITIMSGVVVYANRGVQNRYGAAYDANRNMDLRSAINGGSLNFNGQEAVFNISANWVHYNTSDSVNAFRATDGSNNLLYLNSTIKNATNLVKTGADLLYIQSANEYTGDTYIDQGSLIVRNDRALGAGNYVYINGGGSLIVDHGSNVTGKTVVVGQVNGNALAMAMQTGASWGGDIMIDNIDMAGGTSYSRTFTPRIYQDFSYRSAITGNIYGGTTPIGASGLTDSRMFSTYDTSNGILDLRGMVRDTPTGALAGPITTANQNQVLRMELVSNNSENTVQLWQPYDAAGRIRLLQSNLVFQGTGNFYSNEASAAIESAIDNPMVGFQMGGRSVMTSDGSANDDLAFFLANDGALFNLSSWEVGVETYDEENLSGQDNFNRGNVTGNSTLGGLNTTGTVSFGTGSGSITFTDMTRFAAYNRDLRLSAAEGGTVNINAALVDGGNGVTSSITKIGNGTVNLNGSTAGPGSVEGVNVLGGFLVFTNYDNNASQRVGSGVPLLLGGGTLVMDGSNASFTESFGTLTLTSGGGALASAGNATTNFGTISIGASSISRAAGSTLHLQSIGGGIINFTAGGMASVVRIGSYATYGANLAFSAFATDWAATDGSGNVIPFTGYGVDTLAAATHSDITSALQIAADSQTESLRFNDIAGTITDDASGPFTLTLNDGGILITSNYTTGTPIDGTVNLTTGGNDLIVHNFASGSVILGGNITGSQNVVFTGSGTMSLTGTNTYTGTTSVSGEAVVAFDDLARFGSTSGFALNGGTLQYSALATTSPVVTSTFTLGGAGGVIQVADVDSTIILRAAAANQFTGEANPVASITTGNPFSGGLTILGPGTVQFGYRSTDGTAGTATATNVTDLLGLQNNYTGLTLIGDGTSPVRVVFQGQASDNAQYTPFGTTYSWADATIVRNNATLEFASKRGDGSRDGQYRFREWFQVGEAPGDQVRFDMTTNRQATLDGQLHIIGDLTINSENAGYADAGSTGNTDMLINPNEGGLFGTGDIIKIGNGNLRFYQSLREWTGDLDIRDGFVGIQSFQTSMFENTGKIYFGDPAGLETSGIQMRVEARYGNSTTTLDSGFQTIDISRDIVVRDNIKQEVRITLGYSPETYLTYSGNINVGSGSSSTSGGSLHQVWFYNEDTTGLNGAQVGHYQHSVMDIKGNLTGSNNVLIFANEGGGVNDTSDESDILLTVLFSGDNTGFTGQFTIGGDGGTNLDLDDAQIMRLGNVLALNDNTVNFRNRGTLQLAGIDKTFTQNFLFRGGAGLHTSAGIENGSHTPTTITFDSGTQAGVTFQDIGVGLRDGLGQPIFGGGTAVLNVVKIGVGETVFGAATGGDAIADSFSSYTGTTTVQEGTLIAGTNNSFSPYSRFIVNNGATLSIFWSGNGFINSIGSLSGVTGASVNIDNGVLSIGGDATHDANFGGVVSGLGDLFIVGGGTQQLSGANTFTGNLGVVNGGLIGGSNSAFGDASNTINLGGVAFVTTNPIDARVELLLDGTASAVVNPVVMNSFDGNDEGITVIGTRAASGTYGFSSTATIDLYQDISTNVFIESAGTSLVQFGGAIQDASGGITSLIKTGSGTAEFQVANSYLSGGLWAAGTAIDGGTIIRHGTLSIGDDFALSTTVVELGDTHVALATDAYLATSRSLITTDIGGSFDETSDGAGGAGNGAFLNVKAVVDGVTITAADIGKRILVKDEHGNPERNGVYEIVSFDATCGQMNLVRAADFDETTEMLYGTSVGVTGGSEAGNRFFMGSSDVTAVNTATTDPVHWLADIANPDVALVAGASGLTIINDIDVNDTNGNGSTILGGTFTTGTTDFQGAVTLQTSSLPGVDNIRELSLTSASNDVGGGVLISGAVTEGIGTTLSINKIGTGTVTLTSGSTSYSGKTTVSAGTLAMSGDTDLSPSSWIEVAGGATLDFSGSNAGDFIYEGPLSGAGTVNTGSGSLIVGVSGSTGVLLPGMSADPSSSATAGNQIGVLTVNGNIELAGDVSGVARLTIQMGATNGADFNDADNFRTHLGSGDFATWITTQGATYDAQTGGNHDRVVATGSFTMNAGGQIQFLNNGGADYQPQFGDIFNLIDWSTVNPNGFDVGNGGNFRTSGLLGDLELPDLSLGSLLYDTSLFNTYGIIVVVPEPGRAVLLVVGLVVLGLRRRRPATTL